MTSAFAPRLRLTVATGLRACKAYVVLRLASHSFVLPIIVFAFACTRPHRAPSLAGNWDAYFADGSAALRDFNGWRRIGFAQFADSASGIVGSIRRRTGEPIVDVARVTVTGDSVVLSGAGARSIRGAWHGDTLAGTLYVEDKPAGRRVRLLRREAPFVVERPYAVWAGAASDSQYAVAEDTLVFMTTRDGARLASYIARPVGAGPFGVVLNAHAVYSNPAARWHLLGVARLHFVAQHVRGRDASNGNSFGDYDTDVRDGFDAVEWAARLPGANGRVGMIGHSDEGRLAWYAAVSAPPHSPRSRLPRRPAIRGASRRTRIWCSRRSTLRGRASCAHARCRTSSDLDIGRALTHLPLSDLPQRLECGDVPLWDRWIAHPTLDAYWRDRSVTMNIAQVRAPVLQISGWYDDSRGPIDYTDALTRVPGHPVIRLVMGPGAHKGIDFVAGEFGPQARVDRQRLQLQWFDHYLLGRNNGVDRGPAVDLFVIGDNRGERSGMAARSGDGGREWYFASGGLANSSGGDGTLDTIAPAVPPPIRSPTIHSIRRRIPSTRGSSRRRSTKISRARLVATRHAGLHLEATYTADRGHGRDVGHALGRDGRQGHRLERDVARCISGRPRRAYAGRCDARAISDTDSARKCR